MRHEIHQPATTCATEQLDVHQVAIDPWSVIQFLQQRRSEKLARATRPDLDPKLVDLLAKLKRRVRHAN